MNAVNVKGSCIPCSVSCTVYPFPSLAMNGSRVETLSAIFALWGPSVRTKMHSG